MSNRVLKWRRGNPLVVTCPKPIDRTDPSAPVVVDSGTFNAYVFDKATQTEMTQAENSGVVLLPVESSALFTDGDIVELQQVDGTRHETNVVVFATNVLQITASTAAVGVGARVIKKLGATLTGGAYGTFTLTNTDPWGYKANIPEEHALADIDELQTMIVEAVLDKVASGAHWERAWDIVRVDPWVRP